MNMLTSFIQFVLLHPLILFFCPDSIFNAPGGATEALPDLNVPSPTFFCIFSFNLHFDLMINSAIDLFLFLHNNFQVTLSAITNSPSIWLSNWKKVELWKIHAPPDSRWSELKMPLHPTFSGELIVMLLPSPYQHVSEDRCFGQEVNPSTLWFFVPSYHEKLSLFLLSTDCLLGVSGEVV